MNLRTLLGIALPLIAAAAAPGGEFAFQYKTIKGSEVDSVAGNRGRYLSLSLSKPAQLKSEPKASSLHPLYGILHLGTGSRAMIVRLDENRGDGKGHDRLIIDLNANGDLTDDPVVLPAEGSRSRNSGGYAISQFGPIQPATQPGTSGFKPAYYAQATVNRAAIKRATTANPSSQVGLLRLQAGWYAEADVQIDGVPHKLGVLDSNANFKLGDATRPQTFRRSEKSELNWTFADSDSWLLDSDRSGRFETRNFGQEDSGFGSIVYFGSAPHQVALSPDGNAITVEPWPGPTGELVLQSEGTHVSRIVFAWKKADSPDCHLVTPQVVNGRVRVPEGSYWLYEIEIRGTGGDRRPVAAAGLLSSPADPIRVVAGDSATFKCGSPLTAMLSMSSDPRQMQVTPTIVGTAGEVYSGFAAGDRLDRPPPTPVYTLSTPEGKPVMVQTREYG